MKDFYKEINWIITMAVLMFISMMSYSVKGTIISLIAAIFALFCIMVNSCCAIKIYKRDTGYSEPGKDN